MLEFITNNYLIWKSLHIISVIAWMAGMFYLPRLFVYHCGAIPNGELDQTLKIMERKLIKYIMNPSMIAAYLFGILLMYSLGWPGIGGWLHMKLLLVLVLTVLHAMMSRYRKLFAIGQNKKSGAYFRILNEVPPLLTIIIVFLVVVKPF